MRDNEKTPAEHMAIAMDGLHTLEESARGLRSKMIAEGWNAENAEVIATQWLSTAIARAFGGKPVAEEKTTPKTIATSMAYLLMLVTALPTIVILTVAGFRWALSL